MISVRIKRKLRGLWQSRTHWAGLALGVLVGAQAQIMDWMKIKFNAEDYALAGVLVYVIINVLRWITSTSLEDKGK